MDQNQKYSRRLEGDSAADQLFLLFKEDKNLFDSLHAVKTNAELIAFLKSNPNLSKLSVDFLTLPGIDQRKSHLATKFFNEHLNAIMLILGVYSLPYCYCGANGARVLIASKKITENPEKRLLETAEFVLDVCHEQAFDSEGRGLISIFKVRIMHAAARYYVRNSIPDEEPVNQDDMLATLLSFSLIVIRGLRKMGVNISENEAEAYVYYWNVIGERLGIKQDYLPRSMGNASRLERDIRTREFVSSENGETLTRSLVDFINSQNTGRAPLDAEAMMTFFLEEKAIYLGISRSTLKVPLASLSFNIYGLTNNLNQTNSSTIRKEISRRLTSLSVST